MKIFVGKVIATKNMKTATVAVERTVTHPLYGKQMKKSRNFQVYDEIGVKVGDSVRFAETRPISKTKKWRIIK